MIAAAVPSGSSAQTTAVAPGAAAVSVQQRSGLIGQIHDPAVANAEQQLGVVQNQLIELQKNMAATNARLTGLQSQITQNQAVLTQDQSDLAATIKEMYVDSGHAGLATALLSSDNFNQAVDRYQGAQHIGDQLTGLVGHVGAAKHDLVAERASLQTTIASSQALEHQMSDQSNRLTAMLTSRNSALLGAGANTRGVVAQLDTLDNASAAAALPGSVSGGGPCGNNFAKGQCTFWVASQRCVAWSGNAFDWWANARAAGYNEGHQPQVGAVVVWFPGGGGAGGVGHVAFVDAVGPNAGIPAGQFDLTEMNWAGWDHVDHRVLPNNAPGLAGFIYGKG